MERAETRPTFVTSRPLQPQILGDHLLSRIGNTPLLPMHHIAASEGISPNVVIFAKAEWFNASGSVKARPALAMIEDAEEKEILTPDKVIIEATSGNTGIALAMIGAAKGYRVKLVMPANVSSERKGILKAYGAELALTDPMEGIDHAIRTVQEMAQDTDRYFRPDQYNNPVNWQSHYETTGVEVWEQTGGAITHFVAGIGTSGTLMGTGRRLREYNPAIQIVEVEPVDGSFVIEGLKHMASSLVPDIYQTDFADETIGVHPDDAQQMARRLAQEEGLFVGYSAGAAAWASLKLARRLTAGIIVTVFPDSGEKYLSLAG